MEIATREQIGYLFLFCRVIHGYIAMEIVAAELLLPQLLAVLRRNCVVTFAAIFGSNINRCCSNSHW